MSGPIPVAIIFYWAWTYLYTLVQTLVYEYIRYRRYPLTDAVTQLRRGCHVLEPLVRAQVLFA